MENKKDNVCGCVMTVVVCFILLLLVSIALAS